MLFRVEEIALMALKTLRGVIHIIMLRRQVSAETNSPKTCWMLGAQWRFGSLNWSMIPWSLAAEIWCGRLSPRYNSSFVLLRKLREWTRNCRLDWQVPCKIVLENCVSGDRKANRCSLGQLRLTISSVSAASISCCIMFKWCGSLAKSLLSLFGYRML